MAEKDQGRRDLIAGKLRAHRAEAGMSQAKVAEAVDKDKATIGYYEQGEGLMNISTAWDLANLYGVSLDALVGREFDPAGDAAYGASESRMTV